MPTEGSEPVAAPESLVERQIREAIERGDFDGLPGSGRPIPDLDAGYDPAWWAKRWVLRNRLLDRAHELSRLAARERARARVPDLAEAALARLAELEREIAAIDAQLPPGERVGPGAFAEGR
jgi:hypothetical protein